MMVQFEWPQLRGGEILKDSATMVGLGGSQSSNENKVLGRTKSTGMRAGAFIIQKYCCINTFTQTQG